MLAIGAFVERAQDACDDALMTQAVAGRQPCVADPQAEQQDPSVLASAHRQAAVMGEDRRILEEVGNALGRHALPALASHDAEDLVDLASGGGFDDLEARQLFQPRALLCHLRIDGVVPLRPLQAVRVELDARGTFPDLDEPAVGPQRIRHAAIFADHLGKQQDIVRRQRGGEGLAHGGKALRIGAGLRIDQRKVIVDDAVVEKFKAPHAENRVGEQRHDHQGGARLPVVDRDIKRRARPLGRQPVLHGAGEIEAEETGRATAFLQLRPSLDEAGIVDGIEATGNRPAGMRHGVSLPWRTGAGAWQGRTCGRHSRRPPCPRSRRRWWRANAAAGQGHGAARHWHS